MRQKSLTEDGGDASIDREVSGVTVRTRILEGVDLSRALGRFLKERVHIIAVVDEYGGLAGILTLEDVIETLLGLEIVDEFDPAEDMQHLARRVWKRRVRNLGLDVDEH